ncbi:fatty acid synthase-like, partial [Dermacentor silvarum]|uniref:fatty acid synthase-like n=1 Tax=Dermacentor silvarum TaxID=543639 RepID=UPI002101C35F
DVVTKEHDNQYVQLSQDIVELDLADNGPDSYLTGHQIQGRILFPAAGYIVLAWKSLAKRCGKPLYKVPVVLEDVRFHRAAIMQINGTTRFNVTIMEGSGQFEISEAGAVAASGRIRMAGENEKIIDMEPPCPNAADIASCDLDAEDVYKELRLRGCEYYDQFQGILKANIKRPNGMLKWDNNWITFIDTMIHGSSLAYPKRALKLPVKIISCRIDPVVHMEMTKKATESGVGYVYDKRMRTCRSGGIILQGLKCNTAPQRVTEDVMVLNEHAFVPHIDSESTRQRRQAYLQEYIDACSGAAQCILQNYCGEESESLEAGKCIYNASGEVTEYNLKNKAENQGLLKTLTSIQEEMNRSDLSLVQIIQSAMETYEKELENDVIRTALFEEDPLRHLLDVVVENTSATKLEVCELVTGKSHCILSSQFTQLLAMAKTRLNVDYTVAFPSDINFTSVNVPEGTSLLHWDPSAVPNKKLPEADLLVACLTTWGSSQLEILAQQLSVQSKKQGFILIALRTAVTPAEQVLMSMGCIQLQVHKEDDVESFFNSYGFTVIGLKSNNFTTLLLLRKTKGILEEAKPEVLDVSSDNFHWIEELRQKRSNTRTCQTDTLFGCSLMTTIQAASSAWQTASDGRQEEGILVTRSLSFLLRSRERGSFGVNDAAVFGSTSIAFSEALDDRELGAETRVSCRGVRFNFGPCDAAVSRPVFDDDGAALAATTKVADGVSAGVPHADPVDS